MQSASQEKLEIARQLRNNNIIEFIPAPEYEMYMDLVHCEERNVATREGDSHVYIITPKENKPSYPLFIHMHGGGFVRGYSRRDTLFCSMIASKVGCKVIDIDYRLAPEYPFPAAFNECYDIVKWAFENAEELNVDKENIAVGGDSAGGNLAAAIALMANQSKDFAIKLQILDYPFLDADTDPQEKKTEADIMPLERMRAFNVMYIDNEEDRKNPFVSLVYAEKGMLIGLPPALVITAGNDCLRFEADKYVMLMADAGVMVTFKRFLASNHGFVVNCMEEFAEAQKLITDVLSKTFLERGYK